jgi:hypothetical protein
MAGGLTMKGMSQLKGSFDKYIKDVTKTIVDLRKNVAEELTDAILANTPVWSGRTVRSLTWNNDGARAQMEVHPDRGDTSPDGEYHYHQEFGLTSKLPLGQEPKRASAEAVAYATLHSADFGLDNKLFVTMNSTASAKVEVGAAPTPDAARNQGVVSALAIAQVKSKYGNMIK